MIDLKFYGAIFGIGGAIALIAPLATRLTGVSLFGEKRFGIQDFTNFMLFSIASGFMLRVSFRS